MTAAKLLWPGVTRLLTAGSHPHPRIGSGAGASPLLKGEGKEGAVMASGGWLFPAWMPPLVSTMSPNTCPPCVRSGQGRGRKREMRGGGSGCRPGKVLG